MSITNLHVAASAVVPAAAAPATPGAGQFLGVDWSSIAEVCVVTLVATVVIVTVFAVGLRLLAVGRPDDDPAPRGSNGEPAVVGNHPGMRASSASFGPRSLPATLGGYLCVGVGGLAVLYGVYLVIPLFHG